MDAVQFDCDRTELFVIFSRRPLDQIEFAVTRYKVEIVQQRYRVDRQRDRPLGLGSNELQKIGRLALDDDVSVVRSTEFADQTLALVDPVDEAGFVDVLETALTATQIHQVVWPALLQADSTGQRKVQRFEISF